MTDSSGDLANCTEAPYADKYWRLRARNDWYLSAAPELLALAGRRLEPANHASSR